MRSVLMVMSCMAVCAVVGKESEEWSPKPPVEPPHFGNFALPISQQPGPLLSFGQNFANKGDLIAYAYALQLKGHKESLVQVVPSVLYGVTKTL